jgi:hypothetical protein
MFITIFGKEQFLCTNYLVFVLFGMTKDDQLTYGQNINIF